MITFSIERLSKAAPSNRPFGILLNYQIGPLSRGVSSVVFLTRKNIWFEFSATYRVQKVELRSFFINRHKIFISPFKFYRPSTEKHPEYKLDKWQLFEEINLLNLIKNTLIESLSVIPVIAILSVEYNFYISSIFHYFGPIVAELDFPITQT